MPLASDLITEFKRTYRTCEDTRALAILQEVDEEILLYVPLRLGSTDVPLVAGQQTYLAAETDLRVWRGRYRTSPLNTDQRTLKATTDKTLDILFPNWMAEAYGTPRRIYTTADQAQGRFGLYPAPDLTTLGVTGATNASPIVIATNVPHNLKSGMPVYIFGVTGNTNANGTFYAWTGIDALHPAGYDPTHFALLMDPGLQIASGGNGVYGGGGNILAQGSPCLTVDVTRKVVLATNSAMPIMPQIRQLYITGMKYYYALDTKNAADIQLWKPLYDLMLGEQAEATSRRDEDVNFRLMTFTQRKNWRSGGRNTSPCNSDDDC